MTPLWRADCTLNFLRNHLFRELLGVTEKDNILSNMIRENMITREVALERQKTENVTPQRFINESFDRIGLDLSDFEEILSGQKILDDPEIIREYLS